MSLDVYLKVTMPSIVFEANVTHNLNQMADAAGIYYHLWRPEEIGITKAAQLIEPLKKAVADMKERPDHYMKYDPANGWGSYERFVPWIERYIEACEEYPDADVGVSR